MIDSLVIIAGFLLSGGLIFYTWRIKRFTAIYSGSVAATDRKGELTFVMPFVQTDSEKTAERIAFNAVRNSQLPKVLLAEHDRYLVKELENTYANIEFLVARTATECIQVTKQLKPDLVVLDFAAITDLTGYDLVTILREKHSATPIVIYAARGSDEVSVERGLQTGYPDYVVKPYSLDELKHAISKVLEKRLLTK